MGLAAWPALVDDDGTWTTGTPGDKAMFDAIKASIEAATFSVTNPAISPAAAIDELVTARGNKASLNIRLLVSLDADGNFILPAGSVFVTANPQTWDGQKKFSTPPLFKSAGGGGSTYVIPSGVLFVNTTSVANAGTAETDLMSYALPANVLDATGRGLRITAVGTFGGNANQKTLKFYVGATVISFLTANVVNAGGWRIVMEILRTGSATETFNGVFHGTNVAAPQTIVAGATAGAGDNTVGYTIKLTGQSNTASSDVTQQSMIVESLG